jgi:hypothetical protein
MPQMRVPSPKQLLLIPIPSPPPAKPRALRGLQSRALPPSPPAHRISQALGAHILHCQTSRAAAITRSWTLMQASCVPLPFPRLSLTPCAFLKRVCTLHHLSICSHNLKLCVTSLIRCPTAINHSVGREKRGLRTASRSHAKARCGDRFGAWIFRDQRGCQAGDEARGIKQWGVIAENLLPVNERCMCLTDSYRSISHPTEVGGQNSGLKQSSSIHVYSCPEENAVTRQSQ